jgi:phospholipid transport system substrate-binding protein
MKTAVKYRFIWLSLLLLLTLPFRAYAGAPLETVEENVKRALDVLSDPALEGESAREAKMEKIRAISEDLFDFTELSKRALGGNWRKLSQEQRKEFVELFTDVLEKAYANKILDYTDEKVIFEKERKLAENKAEVQSTVITKTKDIPLHYRLVLNHGEWRVYDLIIEGVSLVRNYRSQFKQILANQSPEELLRILRKKVGKAS